MYRQGLAHAEAFLAAGETAAGVREPALNLYVNAGGTAFNLHQPVECLRHYLAAQALGWTGPYPATTDRELSGWLAGNWAATESIRRFLPIPTLSALWHDTVRHWLARLQPAEPVTGDRQALQLRIDSAHALLLLDGAAAGAGFRQQVQSLAALIDGIEGPWRRRRAALAAQLRADAWALLPEGEASADADDCAERLGAWLKQATRWQRLCQFGRRRRRRVAQALADWRATTDRPAPASPRQDIERIEARQARWLAGQIVQHGALPGPLAEPAAVALGILLANQPGQPAAVVAAWAEAQPWHDDATLDAAWTATQPQRWNRFDDGCRAALYQWLGTMPADTRLSVDAAFANQPEATLDAAVRAWTGGERATLRALLHGAWLGAQVRAQPLAHGLAALRGGGALSSLFAAPGDAVVCDAELRAQALAAVLLGDVQATVARALSGWLDARLPFARAAVADTLQTLRRRFSELHSLHPGPPEHQELGERLRGWCQRLLSLTLAAPAPDPDRFGARSKSPASA